jgi:hypothetical protein
LKFSGFIYFLLIPQAKDKEKTRGMKLTFEFFNIFLKEWYGATANMSQREIKQTKICFE